MGKTARKIIIFITRWLLLIKLKPFLLTLFKTYHIPRVLTKTKISGHYTIRSSHRRCFVKNGVLRNLCQSLFINKVAGLRPASLLKKRLFCKCLPVNFAKFLRTSFLQNTFGRLLPHYDPRINIILKMATIYLVYLKNKNTYTSDPHLSGKKSFLIHKKPLQNDKNAFYFILKSLFLLKTFEFLSWFFGQEEHWLD